MIERLNKLTNELIKKNINNTLELKKYKLIKKIINKKDSFLNIDIEYAYSILRDLQIPENEIKQVYLKLLENR